jgi:hypothetical protein
MRIGCGIRSVTKRKTWRRIAPIGLLTVTLTTAGCGTVTGAAGGCGRRRRRGLWGREGRADRHWRGCGGGGDL